MGVVLCAWLVAGLASSAHAWKMTEALQQEIWDKELDVDLAPKDPHAHFDLAITYAYTNKIQEGYDQLKKVSELNPKYAPIIIKEYSDAVAKDPKDWRSWFRLAFGYFFIEPKQRDKAIQCFKEVVKIDPRNVFAYGFIGTIYGEMKQPDKGVEWIKKGLTVDSNVAVLHYVLGQGYTMQGDKGKGFAETVEALRLKALGY